MRKSGMEVKVQNGLGELDFLKIAKEEIFKTAVKVRNEWQNNLQKGIGAEGMHGREYRNTGEAINDITVEPKYPALDMRVGGDVVQLAIAEYGRRPNAPMPPHEPIARWANEVGLTPKENESFDSMVFKIRRSIGKNGLKAFAPGRLAAIRGTRDLPERITDRIDREAEAAAEDAGVD